MQGLKFRRQHPLGNYFADFACIEIGLIVELDGGQHGEALAIAYDSKRTDEFAAMGFQVLRFWDNEVLNETEAVLEKIFQTAQTLTPTLSRKQEREKTGAERGLTPALTPTLSRKQEREKTGAERGLTPALTPTLSRKQEREKTGAERGLTPALTPTLSRKQEREKTGAERGLTPALTPTLSRKREREMTDAERGLTPALTRTLSRKRERQ
jgi:hypothetical protein